MLVGIPAQHLLRRPNLVLPEWRSVRLRRVLRVRCRVADVAANDDQRRPPALGVRRVERGVERDVVVHISDVDDVPAVGLEALGLVLVIERESRRPVDRDPVVVVDQRQLSEAERAGERGRLLRDALHEIAVGGDRVDAMVDDLVSRAGCIAGRGTSRPSPSRRRCATPWPNGPVVVSMPGSQEMLGVTWSERLPLAEALQLLEREVVAGEVECRVLEDAGVARRRGRTGRAPATPGSPGSRAVARGRWRTPRGRAPSPSPDGLHWPSGRRPSRGRGSCRSRDAGRPWPFAEPYPPRSRAPFVIAERSPCPAARRRSASSGCTSWPSRPT